MNNQSRELRHSDLRRYWTGPPPFAIRRKESALVVIDMQRLTCDRNLGIGQRINQPKLARVRKDYFLAIEAIIPKIRDLIEASRSYGIEIVCSYIEASTRSGKDLSSLLRGHGLVAVKNSLEAEILPVLAIQSSDLRLPRTAFSMFTPWAADQLLRNMGIRTLMVVGVLTDGSVASSVRDAADRGYQIVVIEDACATLRAEDHRAALEPLSYWCGHVVTKDQALDAIKSGGMIS